MEVEGNGKGNTEMPPSSGNELMLANWLLEEANVPADNGTRRVAADAIRLLAKEGGTTQTAAQFILEAAKQAVEDGDTVNRFWFTDQKYKPHSDKKKVRRPGKITARTEAEIASEDEAQYQMYKSMSAAYRAANPQRDWAARMEREK